MKTFGNLFESIVHPGNLYAAWCAARRGKRYRVRAAEFELEAERNLMALERELRSGSYTPGRYRLILIREPKRRVIAAAPFRDRVVHHAVSNVLVPPLARSFIDDTYACIRDRGTHRAVLRHLEFMRRYRYRCHLDVRAFFASINVDILMAIVRRRITDGQALDLLARIVESGLYIYRDVQMMRYLGLEPYRPDYRCGLPVGNLTSQHLANVYLNGLDHHIKRKLKVRGYLRYMDDMVLFGHSRRELTNQAACAVGFLNTQLRLQAKAAPRVAPTRLPVRYLGYRIGRDGIQLDPVTLRKVRLRMERINTRDVARIERSLCAYRGLLLFTGRQSRLDQKS